MGSRGNNNHSSAPIPSHTIARWYDVIDLGVRVLWGQIRSGVVWLLVLGAIISVLAQQVTSAGVFIIILCINVLFGFVHEFRSQTLVRQYGALARQLRHTSSFSDVIAHMNWGIALVIAGCLLVTLIAGLFVGYYYPSVNFIPYAISLLVGVLPESIFVVITMLVADQAVSLARHRSIVHSLGALESIGTADVIIINQPDVLSTHHARIDSVVPVSDDFEKIISHIARCDYERTPLESAIDAAVCAHYRTAPYRTKKSAYLPVTQNHHDYPDCTVLRFDDVEYLRGSWDSVAGISTGRGKTVTQSASDALQVGRRVMAVAMRPVAQDGAVASNSKWQIIGICVFSQPLDTTLISSFNHLRQLQIPIKIITDDTVESTTHIAYQLYHADDTVALLDLGDSMSDTAVRQSAMYANCSTRQAVDIINRHCTSGTVAYVGGMTLSEYDTRHPALITVAVPGMTDNLQQQSDIVLVRDPLHALLGVLDHSRRMYRHIMSYIACVMTGNIAMLVSLSAVTVLWAGLPVLSAHILLANLLTDIPLMIMVRDRLESSSAYTSVAQLSRQMVRTIVIFASVGVVFQIAYFLLFRGLESSITHTGWLVYTVLSELFLVLSLRSRTSGTLPMPYSIQFVIIGAGAIAITAPFWSVTQSWFGLVPLPAFALSGIIALASLYYLCNELIVRLRIAND